MARSFAPGALNAWESLTARLAGFGEWLPPFALRLLLGWEFYEAGLEKWRGQNWFADVQSKFPVPFDALPAELSWQLATGAEVFGAIALWLGLFTRFFAYVLLVLTFVATAAVHWPESFGSFAELWRGYAISNEGHGNFKLPLLFAVMLLPLVFGGAGRLSLDHLLARLVNLDARPEPLADAYAWAIGFAALAVPFLLLMPSIGLALAVAAVATALFGRFARA